MQERSFWLSWAGWLQRRGADRLAADLLELTSPLALFLAQILYVGQPLLANLLPTGHWQALAELCENQNEWRTFVNFLRQEGSE